MSLASEDFKNTVVDECLCGIMGRLLALRDVLVEVGVKIDAIEINNWPRFDGDDINIKIWDGENHILGTGAPGSTNMTPLDVIALAKRRQILQRKF